jgi:hypothetical protein
MNQQQPAKQRPQPQRTCVICGEKRDKRSLTRVVNTETGLRVDPSGKLDGRGAYLCEKMSCWEQAVRSPLLGKALRMALTDIDRKRLIEARP